MPSGLFEVDLDEICRINKQSADWRAFFSQISEEKIASVSQTSPSTKEESKETGAKQFVNIIQEAQK